MPSHGLCAILSQSNLYLLDIHWSTFLQQSWYGTVLDYGSNISHDYAQFTSASD